MSDTQEKGRVNKKLEDIMSADTNPQASIDDLVNGGSANKNITVGAHTTGDSYEAKIAEQAKQISELEGKLGDAEEMQQQMIGYIKGLNAKFESSEAVVKAKIASLEKELDTQKTASQLNEVARAEKTKSKDEEFKEKMKSAAQATLDAL